MTDNNDLSETFQMFGLGEVEYDAESREIEQKLSFEEMLERQQAEKLYTKARFGSRELTIEEKQLLVKWNLARFSGDSETEFGKFELIVE